MLIDNKIFIGTGEEGQVFLLPQMANRHGLISGATGSGKTTTLKVMAEGFSELGVPVFMADVKGDLASISVPGAPSDKMNERLKLLNITNLAYQAFPVECWDVFAKTGHPVRTTVSEMGPMLFARLLDLNDTQRGVLSIIFRIADDNGLLLLDMKDFRAMLQYVGDNAKQFTTQYGNITAQSVGAIQRSLAILEEQGAVNFFAEPAIDVFDWIKCDGNGHGVVNILDATVLYQSPDLYATLLLFMLSEIFEKMPEVGDLDKPKLVFFFDEAHLLFRDAPKALMDKIEQVVRLVRSKGVGVYFITQSPMDVPQAVLGQLGNRVQHVLRAFTPADQKIVKAAADTFRENPKFKVAEVLTELATGEALVSTLDEKGSPGVVNRVWIAPPQSTFGTIDDATRQQLIKNSSLMGKYEQAVDRDSAYEMLQRKYQEQQAVATQQAAAAQGQTACAAPQQAAAIPQPQAPNQNYAPLPQVPSAKEAAKAAKEAAKAEKEREKEIREEQKEEDRKKYGSRKRSSSNPGTKFANAAMSSMGRSVTNALIRGLLGGLKK